MPIKDLLQNLSATERAEMKVEEFSKCALPTFMAFGHDITVTEIHDGGDCLSVTVLATKDGKNVELNNPFIFKNPPILVPDGTFREVIGEDGSVQKISNFKEDLDQSLVTMITEALRITWL